MLQRAATAAELEGTSQSDFIRFAIRDAIYRANAEQRNPITKHIQPSAAMQG